MTGYNKKEFGDYQTPLFFTDVVCNYLKNNIKINPTIIIEPTCGVGNFLKSCYSYFPESKLYGIEINNDYLNKAKSYLDCAELFNENIFEFDFSKIKEDGNESYLIIGNPPWVTNTELSKLDSKNTPLKTNFKENKGLESLMGESNFDISESIILKMIEEFKDKTTTIVFLCKTTVARNVFKELIRTKTEYSEIKTLNFNENKVFKISTSACILVIRFQGFSTSDTTCSVYDIKNPEKLINKFGYYDGKFYSNITKNYEIDGVCCFEWRQGVKHDCSKVMELTKVGGNYKNKNKESFLIEDTLVYPLLKSSNLKNPIINDSKNFVIITQKKIRDDTDYIKDLAPKTWDYLNSNKEFFDKRKSIIYKNAPEFSIFGIGDYSFANYKVGISGFYKNPLFSLIHAEKPIMLDDTCYFLSFESYDDAYIMMLILNTELVQNFLKDIAFLDSKRPYTKKILKRIDIKKCLKILTVDDLINTEKRLKLDSYINETQLNEFKEKYLNNNSLKQSKLI